MTLDEFRATRRPATPEMLEALAQEGVDLPEGAVPFEYADGNLLHERDGGFWPHAWWYAPVRRETLAEAEEVLFNWRAEFI